MFVHVCATIITITASFKAYRNVDPTIIASLFAHHVGVDETEGTERRQARTSAANLYSKMQQINSTRIGPFCAQGY